MIPTPPPEPDAGQDDPPDLRTALAALALFLADVAEHLATDPDRSAELRLRLTAHRHALRRLRRSLGDGYRT